MLLLDIIGYFILGHYIIYYIILNCYTYDKITLNNLKYNLK